MPVARVLLLHGIASRSRSLRRLQRAIEAAGYRTLNLDYASRRLPLEQLVEQVHRSMGSLARESGRIHVVTYSMGGLLGRALIARHRPPGLGRVVMLAPPNGGSEIADLLAGTRAYRWLFGPAGAELTTRSDERLRRLLGRVDYELGVVAGDRTADPLSWLLIPGANDGRVSVARTALRGMADHVTVHATHFGMMRNREAIFQATHFLQHGRFARPS